MAVLINTAMKHFIYKTTCLVTGKFYLGMHSTENENDGYMGSGKILLRSLKKYGKDQHRFEILEFLSDRQTLQAREREIITEELISDPLCMNLKVGGEGGGEKGVSRSAETRAKMSASMKGVPKSPEHIEKVAALKRGTKHSEETKAKMSASRKGKKIGPFSEEHRAKLSESRRKRVTSEETKAKMSESAKRNKHGLGWKPNEEQKRKHKEAIEKALKGKPQEKVTCPHCNKEGGKPAMMRFHFDNCKEKL